MTVEIAVMNKNAVALAADSAVVYGNEKGFKIYNSAKKIFDLSKTQPVGIMIYGNACFMKFPWAPIIKIYRDKLGNTKYDTLREYAKNFLLFLENEKIFSSSEIQKRYLQDLLLFYFGNIKKEILEVGFYIDKKNHSNKQNDKLISRVLLRHLKKIKESNFILIPDKLNMKIGFRHLSRLEKWELGQYGLPHYKRQEREVIDHDVPLNEIIEIENKYKKDIDGISCFIFKNYHLPKEYMNILRRIGANLLFMPPEKIENFESSGVVIAGYGASDIFPRIQSFEIGGLFQGNLQFNEYISAKIDNNNEAMIIPFAQTEMVDAFILGVDPDFESMSFSHLEKMVLKLIKYLGPYLKGSAKDRVKRKEVILTYGKQLLEKYFKNLQKFRMAIYTDPVIGVVGGLPQKELAEVAEEFINLTAFKKRLTMEPETVGGPIDVAVISKSDGFVWIKKKNSV